jgi:hypothetical protein
MMELQILIGLKASHIKKSYITFLSELTYLIFEIISFCYKRIISDMNIFLH